MFVNFVKKMNFEYFEYFLFRFDLPRAPIFEDFERFQTLILNKLYHDKKYQFPFISYV